MAIYIIAAIDDKNGLSARGKTPWHEPADLAHFKRVTAGATVLMGHGTYNAIGHALPGRTNVVATHNPQLQLPGCRTITDMSAFLRRAQQARQNVWVIGGVQIYAAALPFAREIHLTHIPGDYGCDAFFPSLDHFRGQIIRYELSSLPHSA